MKVFSYLSGGAAWGGGALGGFRLRKAFSHLFFMLPADDEDNLRSTAAEPLSALAANNSLCWQKKMYFVRNRLIVVVPLGEAYIKWWTVIGLVNR